MVFSMKEHLTEQHQTNGGQVGYMRVGGREGEEGLRGLHRGKSDSLFNVLTSVRHSGQSNVSKMYYSCKDNIIFFEFSSKLCVILILICSTLMQRAAFYGHAPKSNLTLWLQKQSNCKGKLKLRKKGKYIKFIRPVSFVTNHNRYL